MHTLHLYASVYYLCPYTHLYPYIQLYPYIHICPYIQLYPNIQLYPYIQLYPNYTPTPIYTPIFNYTRTSNYTPNSTLNLIIPLYPTLPYSILNSTPSSKSAPIPNLTPIPNYNIKPIPTIILSIYFHSHASHMLHMLTAYSIFHKSTHHTHYPSHYLPSSLPPQTYCRTKSCTAKVNRLSTQLSSLYSPLHPFSFQN